MIDFTIRCLPSLWVTSALELRVAPPCTACDHLLMQLSSGRVPRNRLEGDVESVARDLLGRVIVSGAGPTEVAVRLTEVEAYAGLDDPASHAYRGRTPRNAVMFGPAGHLYTYFVYGMHFCANVTCLQDGEAGAVLLRAGRVVSDPGVARVRRPTARRDADLARGPARLASLLGLGRD